MEFPGSSRSGDRVQAIAGVDLSVTQGERLALVGQSGCGKTTLLRVIAGLQPTTSGQCRRETKMTSFVFQQPALLPWRRVIQNVMLPLQLQRGGFRRDSQSKDSQSKDSRSKESIRQAAVAALQEVELGDEARRFPYQLSGGMKMRVSIARALVTRPDLLLLDEPFAALDDLLRNQLGGLVTELWRSHRFTMILVTHNIAEAIALSDRICVIHEGRVYAVLANPIAESAGEAGGTNENKEAREIDVRRTPEFAAFYGVVSDCLREAVRA